MNAEVFEQEIQKSTTYGACDGSSWHRSAAAEGRWGILTKCGVTECVTDRHEDQRSSPSTQIPRAQVFWNENPRRTVVPVTIRHTCRRG